MVPDVSGIREAPLYVDDIDAAEDWYNEVLGLETAFRGEAYCFLDIASDPQQYAILFDPDSTTEQEATPPHGTDKSTHLALGIDPDDLEGWREQLDEYDIDIEQETAWEFGDHSIYFRDPDDNSIELYAEG